MPHVSRSLRDMVYQEITHLEIINLRTFGAGGQPKRGDWVIQCSFVSTAHMLRPSALSVPGGPGMILKSAHINLRCPTRRAFRGVLLDKSESVVKNTPILCVASAPQFLPERLRTKTLEISR